MTSSWKSIFVMATILSVTILVVIGLTANGIAFRPFF